jgi:hypothetical protein
VETCAKMDGHALSKTKEHSRLPSNAEYCSPTEKAMTKLKECEKKRVDFTDMNRARSTYIFPKEEEVPQIIKVIGIGKQGRAFCYVYKKQRSRLS